MLITIQMAERARDKAMTLLGEVVRVSAIGLTKREDGWALLVKFAEPPPFGAQLPSVIDGVPLVFAGVSPVALTGG